MQLSKSERGFVFLLHKQYLSPHDITRLLGESSAIGDYDNSYDKPGSSFLWFGDNHHLNREEVAELVGHLQRWLETGSLAAAEGSQT